MPSAEPLVVLTPSRIVLLSLFDESAERFSRRIATLRNMSAITKYLAALAENVARGDATEHTHRPALKALIEALGDNVTATNEPKRIACGAPDLNITRGSTP